MPRRIIGGALICLDGVVQAPGGPDEDTTGGFAHGGWLEPLFEEALGHQIPAGYPAAWSLFRLGRSSTGVTPGYRRTG